MKNKKLILILIATITVIAAATVLSACDKNKGEFVDVGIELYSAKQYYVEGETFTPEGGILKVYSYNEKTKEEKYRFVDLTDKDVTLENTTGARVDTYTVTARYKGLSTRFKYIVQKEENAVASVDFVLSEDHGAPVYSVSDIRSEIDFSDFIGMKFVIKYRNTEKQDEEVPLWDENSYRFYDLSYSGFDVKTAGLKYITFTCIATDVVLPYKVTEDDFVYDFEFVKYDKEKKEYVSVKKEDSVRRNYLVGEKFDAQNTKIRYIYKSLKKAEPVDISESQISGFNTATVSDKKMFILSLLTGVETFNYSVFEETAVKGVTLNNKDFSQPTPGFNDVWTEKTKGEWMEYEEYIAAIKLCLVLDEDDKQYVPVTGADKDIILLYYVTPDEQDLSLKQEFTKEVFDELKKTACEYEIIAVYRKNPKVYARRIFFTVKNFITGIDFVNLNVENLTFTEGDAFSFGKAKAIVHYADSNADTEVRLQEEYEKADENTRLIRMKNTKAVEAKTFDMSAGEHKKQYYITANIDVSVYEVTVNGEKFVKDNGFRIYISYVVQKA